MTPAIAYKPPEQHDEADRAYFEAMEGKRVIYTATAEIEPEPMPGWNRKSWIKRLKYLAAACEPMHPARAAELQAWAAGLENEVSNGQT